MKRLLLSLHVTRWLRVVAVAGVVLASASVADQDPAKGGDSYQTSAASAWCPRC